MKKRKIASSDEVTSPSLKWENKIYEPKSSFKQFFKELSRKFIIKKSRICFIFSWYSYDGGPVGVVIVSDSVSRRRRSQK